MNGARRLALATLVVVCVAAAPARTAGAQQSGAQQRQQAVELLRQQRVAEAIEALEAVLETDPDDAAARFHLGRALLAAGEAEDASEQLRLALVGSADPGAVYYQLGLALLASEEYTEAWEALQRALELRPALRPAEYALAELCYEVGQVARAQRRLATLAMSTPNWPDPEVRAAELAMQQGDPAGAADWLEHALQIAPNRPGLWSRRADALAAAFEHDAAEHAYRRAVELAPGALSARAALGYHLFNVQRFELAEAELARALAVAPGDPSILLPYAETLLYRGKVDASLAAADATLAAAGAASGLRSLRVGALELRARILVKLGRLQEAEQAGLALLQLAPRSVQGHFVLGTVLQRRQDPSGAEHLRTFKTLSDAREHRELGDEFLRLAGDAEAAEREYRAALEVDPDDVRARSGLGRALLGGGDPEAAAGVLETLLPELSHDPVGWAAWILALHGSGRALEARSAWQEARASGLRLGPDVWIVMRGAPGVCDASTPQ